MKSRVAQSCRFNELRDNQRVVSGLGVDLTEALQTGIVRDSGAPTDSNGITDPSMIVGRVENIFDAIESQRAIKKYGKKAAPKVTPSEPSGAPAPNANPNGA